jgi:hypothetical protein
MGVQLSPLLTLIRRRRRRRRRRSGYAGTV